MTLRDEKLTLGEVIKGAIVVVPIIVSFALMSAGISNLTEKVVDIRATQIENSRKNEIRDEVVEKRLSQIETNQKITDIKVLALEEKLKK